MKLNKRYIRNVKSNLAFYIPASILTAVGLVLFFLFYISGNGIDKYGIDFFKKYKVEDATFTTYIEIPDSKVNELEEKYDLTLEKEYYVNTKEEEYNTRTFRKNEKIDLYEIQSGKDIENDNEIIISAGYAVENNTKIGRDKLIINGKEYLVVGTFLRPDYLYMLENVNDDYKNVKTFFLAYMSDDEFNNNFSGTNINYKVIYNSDENIINFRKEMNNDYIVSSYMSKDNNIRISFVHEQAELFIICSWLMLAILPFFTVILISIMIGRKIKSEQKTIGTLSAMGYSKGKLTMHYSIFALIPGVIGGVLTSILALIFVKPVGSLGLADYEPLKPKFSLPIWISILAIIIPTLIYWLCSLIRISRLLKRNTVDLLNNKVGNNGKNRRIMANKNVKVKTKMAIRTLVSNPGRSFVIFLGIFLGSIIMTFSLSIIDSVKEVGKKAPKESGSFKYEYVLNYLETSNSYGCEKMMVMPFEAKDETRFSIIGCENTNSLWNLTTTKGERADIDNGWYISTLTAAMYNLKEGDTFTFRNVASLEEESIKIKGIIKNGYQSYAISSFENASKITKLDSNCYNVLLAKEEINIEKDKISEIVKMDTFQTQMDNMLTSMGGIIYAAMGIGAIICIASLFAVINMMVNESANNISMLKVLGLENRRINSMVISSNHILLIPGTILGVLFGYLVMVWYSGAFVKIERIIIPSVLYFPSVCIAIGATVLSYFISLFLVRRKVNKVDTIECLKDNRE